MGIEKSLSLIWIRNEIRKSLSLNMIRKSFNLEKKGGLEIV